jgi:release factor glutamine methyltransferase
MRTLREWLKYGESQLAQGPHPERARRDAELLLLHLLSRDRAWLIAHGLDDVPEAHTARYDSMLARRKSGEPVQYITGEQEFYGLSLHVTRDVLIPRPETEHLVERALALAAELDHPRIIDVGTGSGAIAIALAHNLPQAEVTAVDLSPAALDVARLNAEQNGFVGRIRFMQSDLLASVAHERFDIVVSNPPYVPANERASLSVEVREHEPSLALFAGDDGLAIYRRLIPEAFEVIVRGGYLALEIGYGQAEEVSALLGLAGFMQADVTLDLQGIARVLTAQKP